MSANGNQATVNDQIDTIDAQPQIDSPRGVTATSQSDAVAEAHASGIAAPSFQSLSSSTPIANVSHDIDLILDIPVQLTVELGRTKIPIKNILKIGQGAVIELDAAAGDPLDVFVNGCLIAKGEVVVVNNNFGIRLTDIITPSERIRKLNR